MARITGNFPHVTIGPEGSFVLDCDKTMFPGLWIPPINWTGYVMEEAVSFVQTSPISKFRSNFDFQGFPEHLDHAIPYIIAEIDKAMRVMD